MMTTIRVAVKLRATSNSTTARPSTPTCGVNAREGLTGCAAIRSEPGRRHRDAHADPPLRTQDRRRRELVTKEPDSFLPSISPTCSWRARRKAEISMTRTSARTRKAKSQAAWNAFARDAPAPARGNSQASRRGERLELVKRWLFGTRRRPPCRQMVLLPMPSHRRTAALLSGQVDWIETPAPDALPEIKARGFSL